MELLYLSAPTVAQSVSYTAMQFIDTWMLSRLGTEEPTAAGNAGMLAFSFICFGFGIMLVVNTLVSQSYGRGEYNHCGRYLWQGYWVALVYSILVLPMVLLGPGVFRAAGHSANLSHLEGQYMQIVLSAVLLKMVATASGQFLLATNRPNSVLVAAVTGVLVNAAVAYALVFGNWGAPKLGVAGSAWAQNAGVFTEMCIATFFSLAFQSRKFGAFDLKPRIHEAIKLVKLGAGAGLQIVADVLAWTIFLVAVMAQLGENAMAANQFMFRYMVVSFMPAWGISQAVTALVGRYIGMRKLDVAIERAHLGFKVAATYMLLCGMAMALFRYQLIHIFTSEPEVVRLGAILLIFAGIYQFFDAMYIVYNGALRGAGDTVVPGIVTAVLCWGITVLGGYLIARYLPNLGVAGPWLACTAYGILLGVFCFVRFQRGSWKAIHLEGSANSNVIMESAKLPITDHRPLATDS